MGDDVNKIPRDPRESLLMVPPGSQGADLNSPAGGPGAGRFKQSAPQQQAGSGSTGDGGTNKRSFWDAFYYEAVKSGARVIAGPAGSLLIDYLLWRYERNADQVIEATRRALTKYVIGAIQEETGQAIGGLVQGLLQSLVMMMAVVAVSTLIGAGAGAAIGALCFGVGAAPGAVVGGEAGFEAGLWILEWLGIGFLAVYVGQNFVQVTTALASGVMRAWNAGEHGATTDQDIEEGAKDIARAVGILFRLILEAIVMYLLQEGAKVGVTNVVKMLNGPKSRLSGPFAEWIEQNHQKLMDDPKTNPKLRETQQGPGIHSGGEEPPPPPKGPGGDTPPPPPPPGKWPTPKAQELLKKLDDLKDSDKAHQKRLISEQLGNEAAKSQLRKMLGKDIPDDQFQEFSGAHTVNLMYKDPATGKVYVLEAKGGKSQLGYRQVNGIPVRQGTQTYLKDVAKVMAKNQDNPAKAAAGRDLQNAIASGNYEYIGVKAPYDSKAPLSNPKDPKVIFDLKGTPPPPPSPPAAPGGAQ